MKYLTPLTIYRSVIDLKNKIGEENNFVFAEQDKRRTNVANEIVRWKDVEETVEDINEWVGELHAEINDAKMMVKVLDRESKAANDKLDKVTSIACT